MVRRAHHDNKHHHHIEHHKEITVKINACHPVHRTPSESKDEGG